MSWWIQRRGGLNSKPSELLAKYEADKASKGPIDRTGYPNPLRWKAQFVSAHFSSMIQLSGGKAEFMLLLLFFLEHQPGNSQFSCEDFMEVINKLPRKWVLPQVRELIKADLALTPARLLQVKDETFMTDKSLKRWTDLLTGLTCTYNEVIKERAKVNEEFKKVMKPTTTPNGVAINLDTLDKLLPFVYPQVMTAEKIIRGVNIDSTELGGRQTTAGCTRILNNEVIGTVTNSAKDSWCFSLHYGPDTREHLQENIIRTGKSGKQSA